EVPENHVIDMNPSPGTLAQVGSEVSLTVSTGRKRVEVPDVRGLDRQEANSQLSDAGLRVSVNERDSNQPPGTVLEQNPPPGQGDETQTTPPTPTDTTGTTGTG